MPAKVKTRLPMPEIAHPEWAVHDASKRLADVEFVGKMEAVVFRFADGRIFGVPVRKLEGLDETPVTRVYLSSYGYAATIEQFSGNRSEVPWDVVLHHADLSFRTGIEVPNLSRLERGKHTPSLDTLEKVADAFEVPVAASIAQRTWTGKAE
jgi:transcriptional regulator with XRE-family HTH domain